MATASLWRPSAASPSRTGRRPWRFTRGWRGRGGPGFPNSTWVNDLRFGWDKHRQLECVTGSYDCATAVGGAELREPGLCLAEGTGLRIPDRHHQRIEQGSHGNVLGGRRDARSKPAALQRWLDNVSYTHGNHIFKFGAEFLHAAWNLQSSTSRTEARAPSILTPTQPP